MEKLLLTGLTIFGLILLTSASPILQEYEGQWIDEEARTLARSWDWRNPFGWRWSPLKETKTTPGNNAGGVATIGEVNMMTGLYAGGKSVNTIAWCDDKTCTTIKCLKGACSGFTYAASISSGSQAMPVIPQANGVLFVPQSTSTNEILQAPGNTGAVQGSAPQDSDIKTEKTSGTSSVVQDTSGVLNIGKKTSATPLSTNTKEIVVPKDEISTPFKENTYVVLKENI